MKRKYKIVHVGINSPFATHYMIKYSYFGFIWKHVNFHEYFFTLEAAKIKIARLQGKRVCLYCGNFFVIDDLGEFCPNEKCPYLNDSAVNREFLEFKESK